MKILTIVIALLLMATVAYGADEGRYQVVTGRGNLSHMIFRIDTVTGRTWKLQELVLKPSTKCWDVVLESNEAEEWHEYLAAQKAEEKREL